VIKDATSPMDIPLLNEDSSQCGFAGDAEKKVSSELDSKVNNGTK